MESFRATQDTGIYSGDTGEDGVPAELESLPRSTESHYWQRVSSDVWEKIILAAFTETGSGRGGDAALKNDRGSPS